jgi:hypothetical protein
VILAPYDQEIVPVASGEASDIVIGFRVSQKRASGTPPPGKRKAIA